VADYARHAAAQAGNAGARPVVVAHSGAGVLLPAIAEAVSAVTAVWLAAYVNTRWRDDEQIPNYAGDGPR